MSSQPYTVLMEWIEYIETHASDLTEWESNFVDSVKSQLEFKGSLSPRQEEILERIYSEKT